MKIRSPYAGAYNKRGMARHALEQFTRARNDFDESIRLDPRSAVYPYNRGLLHLDLDSYA